VAEAPRDDDQATDGFTDWELDLAAREVRAFLASRRKSLDLEFDDLHQQCLLHWWQQRGRHDPNKGASPKTFMAAVLRSKLLDIERAAKAQKRGGGVAEVSLDSSAGVDSHDHSLADVIPDSKPTADPARAAVTADLRDHIDRAVRLLTPRQRQLLDGLRRGYNITEVSERLAVSRPTLHEDVKRIRKVFRDQGLQELLD